MALKIKAKEKKLKFSKDGPEVYRYVMVPDLYSTLDQDKVIKEAAIRSGVSEGVMSACWKGVGLFSFLEYLFAANPLGLCF
jgi:hypothetical protein